MSTWIEAISLTLPTQAHLVQGYLESEGIETMLKDEMISQVNNMYSNAVGGVKVMVRRDEFDLALKLLQKGGYLYPEVQPKMEVVIPTNSIDKKRCPFCSSDNIGKKKSPDVIFLLASLFFGMIFPFLRRTNLCFDCGKEWIFKK